VRQARPALLKRRVAQVLPPLVFHLGRGCRHGPSDRLAARGVV